MLNEKYDYNNPDLEKKNRKFSIIYDYSKSPVYSYPIRKDFNFHNYIKNSRFKRKNLYHQYTNKNVFKCINLFFNFKRKIKCNYTFTSDYLNVSQKIFIMHDELKRKIYLIKNNEKYTFIDLRKAFDYLLGGYAYLSYDKIYSISGLYTIYSTYNSDRLRFVQLYFYTNLVDRYSDNLDVNWDRLILRFDISRSRLKI